MCDAEAATTDHNHSYALKDSDDGDAAVVADTLLALTEQIAVALDCSECCIYEYLPEREALCAQAIWGRELSDEDRAWIGQVNHLTRLPGFKQAIEWRELFVCYPDDEADALTHGSESMAYWGELAAVYAPIIHDGEVLGVLELTEKRRRREFDQQERRLIGQMADLAAVALKNARESHAARSRNRQLQALIDSSRAMSSSLDLDEVLEVVCRQVALALDAQSSYIYEYRPASHDIVWLAHYQRDERRTWEDDPLGSAYDLATMPQDREVIEERRPVQVCIDDPELDLAVRDQLDHWEEKTSLMVPLVVGDEVVGALEVSEAEYARHFSEAEVELCRALGEQAGVAIRNAQLYRTLQEQKQMIERQATIDGLTGLFNHRCFYERLRAEIARSTRYGFPLSLVMLDLDDFKSVNDRYGHPAGDRVLRKIGEILQGGLREHLDVAARYGGEEFAVILPHTGEVGPDDGAAMAERLRRAIAATSFVVDDDQTAIHVTASVGLASLPARRLDADGLVERADRALYTAKRRGKDRVEVFAEDETATPQEASPRQ